MQSAPIGFRENRMRRLSLQPGVVEAEDLVSPMHRLLGLTIPQSLLLRADKVIR